MAVPISKKILLALVLITGALLIAAAPPSAFAPDAVDVTPTAGLAVDRGRDRGRPGPGATSADRPCVAPLPGRRRRSPSAWWRPRTAPPSEVGLDPLLVLAVIAVESRFNPIAESGMGAKGLMQIIPRFHLDKLRAAGGEDAVFDPESNILVGARILQEYVYRTGTLDAGLAAVQRRLARFECLLRATGDGRARAAGAGDAHARPADRRGDRQGG